MLQNIIVASSLGLILCPILSHKGEEERNRCKHRASHLSDQIFLFHLKFCFVVNDVDNFSQLVMNEHLTNANEQMLIRRLIQMVSRNIFFKSIPVMC